MEYKIIEGKKIGSHNYECQGYLYFVYSSNPKSTHLRCTIWRTRGIVCNGTGRIDLENNLLYPKHVHSHTEADYQSDICLKKSVQLKRQQRLRQVFDNVTSSNQAGAMVTYRNVRNTMLKRRRLELPGNPKTPEQFSEMMMQTRFAYVFERLIIFPEGFAAIFLSDLMFESLKGCEFTNFDGTFHVVPKLFYQLFTIFIQEGHHALPAIHVLLMSKKSESLYEAVLKKIADMMPDFQPKLAVGDYGKAPRNAFRTIFTSIDVSGCLSFIFLRPFGKR